MTITNIIKYLLLAAGLILSLMASNMASASEKGAKSATTKAVKVRSEMQEVIVLALTAKSGSIITANMLTTKMIAKKRISGAVIQDEAQIIGMEVARTVRANAPIFISQLREAPVLRKGDLVTIQFTRSGLTLTAEGTSLQDAQLGDRVRVLSENSKKMLKGTLISNNLVEVK